MLPEKGQAGKPPVWRGDSDHMTIVLTNVTTATALEKVIREQKAGTVFIAQEMHTVSDRCDDALKRWHKVLGVRGVLSPAQPTSRGGTSGGCGVFARRQVPILDAPSLPDEIPRPPKARFSAALLGGLLKGPVLFVSVYLISGLDLTGPNADILQDIGGVVRAIGLPFVLGGDWQNPPSALAATAWAEALGELGADIISPGSPTCLTKHTKSEIDYFVVDRRLSHMIDKIWVASESGATRPHRPVVLRLKPAEGPDKVQVVRRRRAIPVAVPIGPKPMPPSWQEETRGFANADSQESLDQAYVAWVDKAEEELVDLHGLHGQPSFRGRKDGQRIVEDPNFGKYRGPVKAIGEAWMWRKLASLTEYLLYYCTIGRLDRAKDVHVKLCRYKCPFKILPEGWHLWQLQKRRLKGWCLKGYASITRDVIWQLLDRACKVEAKEARLRSKQWHHWAQVTSMDQGARLAHRWAKGDPPWLKPQLTTAGKPESRSEHAGRCAGKWHTVWKAEQCVVGESACDQIDWEGLGIDREAVVSPPSVQQLREYSSLFTYATALGSDELHPRHLAQLSDGALIALRQCLIAIVRIASLPSLVRLLKVVLLPKPDGGDRPIGLFASVIRVWAKFLFAQHVGPWQARNARPYFFGEQGKTCEDAVWLHSALAEYAQYSGKSYAAALLDLTKAYEKVDHKVLAEAAARYGFPLRVLKIALMFYRMSRVVIVEGLATSPVFTAQTIVAGCSFATVLLRLMLLPILDSVAANWPSAKMAVVVDDITIAGMGKQEEVASTVSGAVSEAIVGLEKAKLEVSDDKSVLMSNVDVVRNAIASRVKRLKKGQTTHTKNLGVDFTAGKPLRHKVSSIRLKKAAARIRRTRVLKNAGAKASRLVSTGLNPALLYGVGVVGMTDSHLLKVRRAARKAAVSSVAGRNLTLDLMLMGKQVDPAYRANRDVILQWCTAWWDGRIPRTWQAIAFDYAMKHVLPAKQPWRRAQGPSGAVMATLKRIGWKPIRIHKWLTHRGEIDICKMCPTSVARLVDEATEKWLWVQVSKSKKDLEHLEKGGVFQPIHRLVTQKPCEAWSAELQGQLRSMVADGQWPQDRLYKAGLVDSPICLACGEVNGTMHHRCWACPTNDGFRFQYDIPRFLQVAKTQDSGPWCSFFTRALLASTVCDAPLALDEAAAEQSLQWEPRNADPFQGDLCGDGSGRWGEVTGLRRCGWSVCELRVAGDFGVVVKTLHGPLPGPVQEVPRAELFALLAALRHSGAHPVRYWTDCRFVVDGFRAGRAGTTQGVHVHADLWKQVWDIVEDRGEDSVRVDWCKGHATRKAVVEGKILEWQRVGNGAADAAAKEGAALHPSVQGVYDREMLRQRSVALVARFLARINLRVHKVGPYDASPDRSAKYRDKELVKRKAKERQVIDEYPHNEAQIGANAWICYDCGGLQRSRRALLATPCGPTVTPEGKHTIWRVGQYVFCIKCGHWSNQRISKLRARCNGSPSSQSAKRVLDTKLKRGFGPYAKDKDWLGVPQPLGVEPAVAVAAPAAPAVVPPSMEEELDGLLLDAAFLGGFATGAR